MILKHNFTKGVIEITELISWLQKQQIGGSTTVTIKIDDLTADTELSEYYPEIDKIQLETD